LAQYRDQTGAYYRGFAAAGGADHRQKATFPQSFSQPLSERGASEEKLGVFFLEGFETKIGANVCIRR
jgi:hypothetical protein